MTAAAASPLAGLAGEQPDDRRGKCTLLGQLVEITLKTESRKSGGAAGANSGGLRSWVRAITPSRVSAPRLGEQSGAVFGAMQGGAGNRVGEGRGADGSAAMNVRLGGKEGDRRKETAHNEIERHTDSGTGTGIERLADRQTEAD